MFLYFFPTAIIVFSAGVSSTPLLLGSYSQNCIFAPGAFSNSIPPKQKEYHTEIAQAPLFHTHTPGEPKMASIARL